MSWLVLGLLGCSGAPAGLPGSSGSGYGAGSVATGASGASGSGAGGYGGVDAGSGQGQGGAGGPNAGMPSVAGSGGAAAGAGGSAGASAALCGEPSMAEPEPAVAPSAVPIANGSAKTILNAGNFDDAGTNVLEPSAAAGVKPGMRSDTPMWQWAEAGAWLEYSVEASAPGSYSIVVLYYSAEPGGIATISVDGAPVGVTRFGASDQVGEYGGVPNCCSRGHGVLAHLTQGAHQVRVAISPRSVPLDVYGLQINFAGQPLENGGKVHVLAAATSSTTVPSDGASDFYRMNFDAGQQAWPCEKSFCRVEYLVQPEHAGRYELSLHYSKHNQQCMGVGFQLEDTTLSVFRLQQADTVTAPVPLELPCGVSRISVLDPNYVDGEFCSYGAMFGALELRRADATSLP